MPQDDIENSIAAQMSESDPIESSIEKQILHEKYGEGISNKLAAFSQGLAKEIPFFGGAYQELIEPNPIARKVREEELSGYITTGQVTSFLGQLLLPGAAAKLAGKGAVAAEVASQIKTPISAIADAGKLVEANVISKGLSKPAAKAIGGAVEGILFSSGQIANEVELGDTKDLGERVAINLGIATILGGLTGYGLGKAGEFFDSKKALTISKEEEKTIEEAATAQLNRDGIDAINTAEEIKRATTPEEMTKQIYGADLSEFEGGMPQKKEILKALDDAPGFKTPPNDYTINSYDDPFTRKRYLLDREGGLFTERDIKRAEELLKHEAWVKKGVVEDLQDTIKSISPSGELAKTRAEATEKLVDSALQKYTATKEALAPLFEKFDSYSINKIDAPEKAIKALESGFPKIGKVLRFDPVDQKFILKKYTTDIKGLTPKIHDAIEMVVNYMNGEEPTLGGLYATRDNISSLLSKVSSPEDMAAMGKLKKALMDLMIEEVDKVDASMDLRQMFKEYAINEQSMSDIEKLLGGKLSDKAHFTKVLDSNRALERILKNPAYTNSAKNLFGEKVFNEAVADWMNVKFNEATKSLGHFKTSEFEKFLTDNTDELSIALANSPDKLKRMKAMTVIGRALPDAPSINPSGSATTAAQMASRAAESAAKGGDLVSDAIRGVYGAAKKEVTSYSNERIARDIMAGKKVASVFSKASEFRQKYVSMKIIEKSAYKVQKAIDSGVSAALKSGGLPQIATQVGVGKTKEEREIEYNKIKSYLEQIVANGNYSLDNMTEMTKRLSAHAPLVTQSLQITAANQTYFLYSKMPKTKPRTPFYLEQKPSDSQIAEFLHYYRAVNDPLVALEDIKNGVLTKQTVEACSTVYPAVYKNIGSELIERASRSKNQIPYQTKLMISMFINQPLDISLQPQSILNNQQSLAAPSVQQSAMPQQGVKPTQKGLEKLGVADRILTPMQKSQQRRE